MLETNDIYEITCIAAVDSRQIFVGLSTGSLLVWTLESGSKRGTFNRQSQVGAHSNHGNTSTLASAALGATASVAGVVTNDSSSSAGSYSSMTSSRHKPTVRAKKVLSAHTDGVTALAICANHNFIVSASRDHTAVIWHLSQLTYIRQLKGHNAAVSAVAANEANVCNPFGHILKSSNFIDLGRYCNSFGFLSIFMDFEWRSIGVCKYCRSRLVFQFFKSNPLFKLFNGLLLSLFFIEFNITA